MPRKKSYPRRYKKRKRFFRRRRKRNDLSTVNAPLANVLRTKLIYTENVNFVSSASTPATQVFSLNGVYDPNITGAGHQPRGFDQLVGELYDHYLVIGTRVKIEWLNHSTSNPAMVMAQIKDTNATASNYTDYFESRNAKTGVLGVEGGGSERMVMYINLNPNKFLGRSNPRSNPQLFGNNASNPVEQCYIHTAIVANDLTATTNVYAQFTIEYLTLLVEPKQPVES